MFKFFDLFLNENKAGNWDCCFFSDFVDGPETLSAMAPRIGERLCLFDSSFSRTIQELAAEMRFRFVALSEDVVLMRTSDYEKLAGIGGADCYEAEGLIFEPDIPPDTVLETVVRLRDHPRRFYRDSFLTAGDGIRAHYRQIEWTDACFEVSSLDIAVEVACIALIKKVGEVRSGAPHLPMELVRSYFERHDEIAIEDDPALSGPERIQLNCAARSTDGDGELLATFQCDLHSRRWSLHEAAGHA